VVSLGSPLLSRSPSPSHAVFLFASIHSVRYSCTPACCISFYYVVFRGPHKPHRRTRHNSFFPYLPLRQAVSLSPPYPFSPPVLRLPTCPSRTPVPTAAARIHFLVRLAISTCLYVGVIVHCPATPWSTHIAGAAIDVRARERIRVIRIRTFAYRGTR